MDKGKKRLKEPRKRKRGEPTHPDEEAAEGAEPEATGTPEPEPRPEPAPEPQPEPQPEEIPLEITGDFALVDDEELASEEEAAGDEVCLLYTSPSPRD